MRADSWGELAPGFLAVKGGVVYRCGPLGTVFAPRPGRQGSRAWKQRVGVQRLLVARDVDVNHLTRGQTQELLQRVLGISGHRHAGRLFLVEPPSADAERQAIGNVPIDLSEDSHRVYVLFEERRGGEVCHARGIEDVEEAGVLLQRVIALPEKDAEGRSQAFVPVGLESQLVAGLVFESRAVRPEQICRDAVEFLARELICVAVAENEGKLVILVELPVCVNGPGVGMQLGELLLCRVGGIQSLGVLAHGTVVAAEGSEGFARRGHGGDRTRRRVVVNVVVDHPQIEIVGGLPQRVDGEHEEVVLPIGGAAGRVLDVGAALAAGRRQLERHASDLRQVKQRFEVFLAILGNRGHDLPADLSRRFGADDVDQAADGVSAEQCALGPPEHFHPLGVPDVQQGAGGR